MKNNINFQEKLNTILQKNTPANVSLAKEISELLDISLDSTYRRLRNETDYTLNEVAAISQHFDIPLEALNNELQSVVTFKVNILNNDMASYQQYLEHMMKNIDKLNQFDNAQVIFAAEDIPVFYHFSEPRLMRFKVIYWLKSLLNITDFQFSHFESITLPQEILDTAEKIYAGYEKLNSTEIWTTETTLSTLKQIKFYWDAGFFESVDTATGILDDLETMIRKLQRNSETGFKFNKSGSMTPVQHRLFLSDVMIGTNCVFCKAAGFATSFISYSSFNFMQTTNSNFNEQNEQWLNNILSKSTLLSGVAEKQRNQFFKQIYKQITEMKDYFKNS